MGYPEEFKNAVRNVHGERSGLIKRLEEGDPNLGVLLNTHGDHRIHSQTIIEMLESGRADDLLKLAKQMQAEIDIYIEWQLLDKSTLVETPALV